MHCHQIKRSEIPSLHKMFLLRKKAIEIENGVTDGTLLTFYHGTKPRNITGFFVEGFNRNYGKSGMYTPYSCLRAHQHNTSYFSTTETYFLDACDELYAVLKHRGYNRSLYHCTRREVWNSDQDQQKIIKTL